MGISNDTTASELCRWQSLLEAYRLNRDQATSSQLLERLGPWLTSARRRLIAVPPYLEDEDIAQQLALQVLHIAAHWRPGCDDNWIARRLVEAAERNVRRALRQERNQPSEELTEEIPSPQGAEPELVFDTPIGKATAADLRVIYRVKVLGEPVAELAREARITPRQMRERVRAAIARAASDPATASSGGAAE